MVQVRVNYTKTVHQNASDYFAKAKKAQKKLEGLYIALKHSQKKLAEILAKKDDYLQSLDEEADLENRKTDWFEQFRWFFTSNGLLAIGGRDAVTNESLMKKHTQEKDLVFHTDMAGSPFFILQDGQNTQPPIYEEVAQMTASYSKAWQEGYSSLAVFYVTPKQVTKQAESGEFLGKGAFVIRGKTTYLQPKLEVCIGFDAEKKRIVCGTKRSIKQFTKNYVTLVQGNQKTSDIAKQILKKLGNGTLDEIIRMIPTGGCRISK